MPDIDMLIKLADFYNVDIREIIDGERKSENMNGELKETVLKVAQYSNNEKEVKRKKLNNYFILGGICLLLVIFNHQFELLSVIFNDPIDDFVTGALTSLGILFELAGFYNNNHQVSLKQKNKNYLCVKNNYNSYVQLLV